MILDEKGNVLEHSGVKGMKWGVRRDPKTGVRPLAKTLDESRFGRAANANAARSMARSDARRAPKPTRKEKRVRRQQANVDRHRRVASGQGGLRDKAAVGLNTGAYRLIKGKGLQGGAQLNLAAAEKHQAKVLEGKRVVSDILARKLYGVDVRDLNYSMIKPKKS